METFLVASIGRLGLASAQRLSLSPRALDSVLSRVPVVTPVLLFLVSVGAFPFPIYTLNLRLSTMI